MSASRITLTLGTATLAYLVLSGCGRGFEYEGGTKGKDGDTTVVVEECGGDVDTEAGINVAGNLIDLEVREIYTRDAAEDQLCVAAVDPAPAVTGGEPIVLASATVCPDGSYLIAGLSETLPALGMMIQVSDCDEQGTVMRTVTGVATEEFDGLSSGDTLEGIGAYTVTVEYLAIMTADLDYPGDLNADGFLAGFVDDADGNPVAGATVTCGACADIPTFYADADPSDGTYTTGSDFNESTVAESGAQFIVPAGIINTYNVDDGGNNTWPGRLFGSLSGYGAFIRFTAE